MLLRRVGRGRLALALVPLAVFGCEGGPAPAPGPADPGTPDALPYSALVPGPATAAVDAFDAVLAGEIPDGDRLAAYGERWRAVQRAVALAGVRHEGAYFASRGYWHTGYLRGGDWSWEHPRDLDEPVFVDGRGTVLVWGDCNTDVTITGDAVVHILGDLSGTVTLRGSGEVIIAGTLQPTGKVLSGSTLDLYTGGDLLGQVQAAGSATLVIDGDQVGTVTAGQPATTMHITGNCTGLIKAPGGAAALLTLVVEGTMSGEAIESVLDAGFTRVTATIARSNAEPGLYPTPGDGGERAGGGRSRWVIHQRIGR